MNEIVQRQITLARHYLDMEQPARSLQVLNGLDGLDDAEYWRVRASALSELERWEEAYRAATEGLAVDGECVELIAVAGDSLTELGRLPEAERVLLNGLQLDPECLDLLVRYSRLLARAGQIEKAERVLERAADIDPEHGPLLGLRIILSHLKGKDAAAEAHARELLARAPDHWASHYLLGFSVEQQGAPLRAARHFHAAAEVDPGRAEVAEAAREAAVLRHPLYRPVLMVHRLTPAGTWLAAMGTLAVLRVASAPGSFVLAFGAAYLALCVYTWVVPPLLRVWLKRRRRR